MRIGDCWNLSIILLHSAIRLDLHPRLRGHPQPTGHIEREPHVPLQPRLGTGLTFLFLDAILISTCHSIVSPPPLRQQQLLDLASCNETRSARLSKCLRCRNSKPYEFQQSHKL
ncbi:uncharacterized protein BDR25DRAFT_25690 [Lindgomyces ingoldianus]|uniref:Uncharacterized protein n=1 Tax=Lindgomyces ingoldianus TaxID=673940 RepID=A0ACB6QXR1_9PLEO|nr:uncharacterized protein BDR25DRAFT_25690 [Lindgomyces ingoldianus]KAF2471310.1 hypothetical protein BDR25DRAFT_25690 [Lindgomyces ingoldianus]